MGECKKVINGEILKAVREIMKDHKTVMTARNGELNNEFQYRMELARGELYEEYLDEKLKLKCRWGKRLETIAGDNRRELMHLRASQEADWTEKSTELELWYETENRNRPVVEIIGDRPLTSAFEVDDYTAQVRELNGRLSTVTVELVVYEKRLRRLLGEYIDFVGEGLRKYPEARRAQLRQATALMAKLKEIRTRKNEARLDGAPFAIKEISRPKR